MAVNSPCVTTKDNRFEPQIAISIDQQLSMGMSNDGASSPKKARHTLHIIPTPVIPTLAATSSFA